MIFNSQNHLIDKLLNDFFYYLDLFIYEIGAKARTP